MVEGDSWELILSPEAEAELKAAMNEDPSKSIPADEVWERLGLSKPEGPRALTGDERKVLKEGLERARRGKMGRSE